MVSKNFLLFLYKHSVAFSTAAFIIILIFTQSLALQRYLLNLSKLEKQNTEELNRVVDQLQFNLNYALSTTKTLSFIVENYGVPKEFDSIAKKLLEANDLIDGIQLLENGVITKMYPLEGNEMVIGYNVVEDPSRGKEVLIAAEKKVMYFGGPFELKQGGMGVVGRISLDIKDDSLAFAAVVIRLEKLLDLSGISNSNERYFYQLSKQNPDTNEMEYFMESNEDFAESQVATLKVPMGEWQIYVKEKNGNYLEGVVSLSILGLFLSFLGGYITRVLLRKPAELQEQVTLQSKIILDNKRRFQALVENSLDSVAIIRPDGSNIYVSPSVTSVLGYTDQEIMKINLFDLLHDDDKPFVAEEMQYIINNPGVSIKGHISRIKHKDGSWRWVESSITNLLDDPAVKGIVNNFRDITQKKDAEEILLKEKELSEAIINSLPGIFYLFNQKGEFLLWNTNFESVSEYSAEEIKNMHPTAFFEGDDQVHIQQRIMETFEKGESFAEAYFTTKSGKKIYHYFTGSLIDYNGETCLLGTGIDVSSRRKAELELKKSEEQMLSIFNNSISAVIMMDEEGLITNWNPKAEEIFGWKKEEVLQKQMHHFIMPKEHVNRHLKGMETYKRTGKGPIINTNIEIDAITKSKKKIDITLGVTTVRIKGKDFFISFINDITKRKQEERIKSFEQGNRDALINSTPDLIWSVSKDLTLLTANEAFKASFKKYTNDDLKEGAYVLPPQLDKDYTNFWKQLYEKALKGESYTYENVIPSNENQNEIVMETNFSPITVEDKIVGVACSARNITERIKTQEEIKEYNEKLKTAQEIAQLGYWEHNYTKEVLFWSDQVYQIFEVEKEKFSPTVESFINTVVPEHRDKFYLHTKKPYDKVENQDIEYKIKTHNGKIKWIHQNGKKIINKKDNSITFKGILRDITERKNQEERILDYIDKLKTAQKIAKLGYWEFDLQNNKLTWSDQVYEIWENHPQKFDVTFENFFQTIHPDDREKFSAEQENVLNGKKPLEIEHRIILKNGKVKWVIERGYLIKNEKGEPLLLEGTVQDITEQKQIEVELREQYNFINTALENLPIGIAVNKLDTGEVTLMNKQFSKIYGWPKKELENIESFFEKVYPDENYRTEMKTLILKDIESGNLKRMNWDGVKITTRKGQERIVNAKNIPVYEQNLMISSVLDVTEKTMAEQQLALSNERYEYVTKATFDAIWDWDLIKNSIYWGEGFKNIFGHNIENTPGNYWYDHVHPDDVDRVKQSINSLIKSNRLNWQAEYRFMHKNGDYRYVKDRGIILRNVERKALRFIGAMQDITPQKEYEQKLIDVNQKLRNLSAYLQEAREEERISIAREIHDELGQQLTGIKLDAAWLKNIIIKQAPEDTERSERLIESINKAINDVRRVASNLRPGVLDDLGLEAAIEWQSQKFQEQTAIKCTIKSKNLSGNYKKEINTAVYRIYQEALTNVMRHAKASEVHTLLYEDNNELILEVKDNGIGIQEKDKNNSHSLGITGMRERALMMNGRFFIQNQKNGGTKVKLFVPLSL